PKTLGSVVPSKTYGLMAAGRPILFIGPRHATPARIIAGFHCGWQVDPGDSEDVVALLERLAADPIRISLAGPSSAITICPSASCSDSRYSDTKLPLQSPGTSMLTLT